MCKTENLKYYEVVFLMSMECLGFKLCLELRINACKRMKLTIIIVFIMNNSVRFNYHYILWAFKTSPRGTA